MGRKRKDNPLLRPIPPVIRPGDAPVYLALEAVYRMGWYLWARNEVKDFERAKEFFMLQLEARGALYDLRQGWHDALWSTTKDEIAELERKIRAATSGPAGSSEPGPPA